MAAESTMMPLLAGRFRRIATGGTPIGDGRARTLGFRGIAILLRFLELLIQSCQSRTSHAGLVLFLLLLWLTR